MLWGRNMPRKANLKIFGRIMVLLFYFSIYFVELDFDVFKNLTKPYSYSGEIEILIFVFMTLLHTRLEDSVNNQKVQNIFKSSEQVFRKFKPSSPSF